MRQIRLCLQHLSAAVSNLNVAVAAFLEREKELNKCLKATEVRLKAMVGPRTARSEKKKKSEKALWAFWV